MFQQAQRVGGQDASDWVLYRIAKDDGLEQTLTAGDRAGAFYDGKRQACRWFFRFELPRTAAQFELLDRVDDTTLEMRDEWF